MYVYLSLKRSRRTMMNRTVFVVSSLVLLLGGCSDKGDSATSQVEKTTVEEVVESAPAAVQETEVITETAEPVGGDAMPEASEEETGRGTDAQDQKEDATKNTGSTMGD
jgi:PBP1b-binding outer membrane lipoprotein LpoB